MGTSSHRSPWPRAHPGAATALLLPLVLLASCTDAPVVEPGKSAAWTLVLPASFGFKGAVAGTPQADALGEAFDRVDRFRLVVRRANADEVVADVVIEVEPGRDVYNLSASVPAVVPGEQFVVVIIAMQGGTVLFESDPVTVTSVPEGATGTGESPQIELRYAGPGADAAEIVVAPGVLVLAPGGEGGVVATVRTTSGAVLAGVPIAWTTGDASVASVSEGGELTAGAQGATAFTATTPTGLSASGWAYVVGGQLAFSQGGRIRVRGAAGGAVDDLGVGRSPSYLPGSGTLVWSAGGRVVVDGRAVTDGGWPSVSPDRTKLAVERSGRVWFTNLDGSNPTEGPAGTTPVWMANGSHLAVGGGSVQRVRADGSDRSTLAGGAASLPALGPGGRIAVVSGDALEVDGQGRLLGGVSGRPAWSPSGAWLVVPAGGELVLVDASGAAPPASLGLAGATDPAWRGSAPSASPASPAIRALEPEPAIPGGEVRLVGSGFDWIIPTNNRVFFPGADGPVEGDVLAATPGTLTALMPATTVAGTIRVRTPQGEATVGFEPLAGSIRVRVQSGEEPVAGVPVVVRQDASEVAKIATDARGEASFALPPGDYGVGIGATPGYRIDSPNPVAVRLSFAVSEVAFRLVPVPARVTIEPEAPVHVPIGTTVNVRARAFDAAGNELTDFTSVSWGGSSRLEVSGKGLSGQLTGVELSRRPGDAGFAVALNGERFRFGATVTAFIEGTVIIDESGESRPARGRTVFLTDDDVRALAETETDRNGRYRFARLLARTYRVHVDPPNSFDVDPVERRMAVSRNRRNQDFVLSPIGGGGGPLRPTVMLCGFSNRDVTTFFPQGTTFDLVAGCAPDDNVQALLVSRTYLSAVASMP